MNSKARKFVGVAIGAGAAALAYMGIRNPELFRTPWKRGEPDIENPVKQESEMASQFGKRNTLMPERELQQAASSVKEQLSKTVTEFKESFAKKK